ncbi:MAG: UDP-N-acetylmuramate--L-alanine ligase [Minisyncoccia bacterium]
MKKLKKIHLIGIGGAGMTSLANLLISQGYKVLGSDIKESNNTRYLKEKGVKIFIGHRKENIKGKEIVVYSAAVSQDNIELKEAKRRKLKIYNRYEYLMEILKDKKIIAVSGTHGKSTTSTMVGFVLKKMNLNPTVYIGATSKYFPYGSEWGKGEFAVVETDEHDKSFLLTPSYLPVILDVDNDHLAKDGPYKGRFSLLKKSFEEFEKVSNSGYSVLNIDDEFLNGLRKISKNKVITFGLKNRKAHFRAVNLKFFPIYKKHLSQGEILYQNKSFSHFKFQLPGKENVLNLLATLAVAKTLALDIKKALRILKDFPPIKRRFNVLYFSKNLAIIDDHADHPTEIKVSLRMIRQVLPGYKIFLVLQPHRYSRVSLLYKEYAKAIKDCDNLVLLPLDPASEKPIPNVDSKRIYEVIKKEKIKKEDKVLLFERENNQKVLFEILKNIPCKKRAIVFMGPGKIASYAPEFVKYLKN